MFTSEIWYYYGCDCEIMNSLTYGEDGVHEQEEMATPYLFASAIRA